MELDDAVRLAWQLLDQYGLSGKGWDVVLNREDKHLGSCNYGHKVIALNEDHIEQDNEREVRDTILHEIAHALTPNHGHDATWQMMAIRLGASPVAVNYWSGYSRTILL